MSDAKTMSSRIGPINARPGSPLYLTVKEAMIEAIKRGDFKPGERLPSTKDLSKELAVSLVTTHRALQELEASGVVDRMQGRGTFVADPDQRPASQCRIGLVLQSDASLSDFYHGRLLDGMNKAARESNAELTIMQYSDRYANQCRGYLLVNPLPRQIEATTNALGRVPAVIVGARSEDVDQPFIDVDNYGLVEQAVMHLHRLGHRRIVFVGGAGELSNSRDRMNGFIQSCEKLGIKGDQHEIVEAASWQLDAKERMKLNEVLSKQGAPTAVIAAGYYLALDVYEAAATLGMEVPDDLSIVGVDDPPSASHLSPPMTTVRQPVVELGHAAVMSVMSCLDASALPKVARVLKCELVIRDSSGAPRRD